MNKPKKVNDPKKIKHYDFSRKPKRVNRFWIFASDIVCKFTTMGFKITIDRVNMDGLKPPYILLATHASMLDFPMMYYANAPFRRINPVSAIDAIRDYSDWVMRNLGCICKRKFIKDFALLKNMRYVTGNLKDIVCLFPEARFSLDGCTSYIPESVGKMCKLLKVPVVTLRMEGNFICSPQWNKVRQKLPLHATIEQIVTAEEIETLDVDEINRRIHKGLEIDDFAYQLKNGIENNYEKRAQGLENLLYRCPHCGKEFEMHSHGTEIWCESCGKHWEMTNLGQLKATDGETEFSHIPNWFKWERACVREEVRSGNYHFEDEVAVHTLPNAKRFYDNGTGKLVQTCDKTIVECNLYGEPFRLELSALELESMHIEYDYPFAKKMYKHNIFGDCVDISIADDSFWLHPLNKRLQLTKLSLATEEIYFWAKEKLKRATTAAKAID